VKVSGALPVDSAALRQGVKSNGEPPNARRFEVFGNAFIVRKPG
jgi:hypothetical protein